MEWIKTGERLPTEGENVLCWNGKAAVMCIYERGEFYVEKYPDYFDRTINSYWTNVSHWQPLPTAPK